MNNSTAEVLSSSQGRYFRSGKMTRNLRFQADPAYQVRVCDAQLFRNGTQESTGAKELPSGRWMKEVEY